MVVFFCLAFTGQLKGQYNQTIENDIHGAIKILSTPEIWNMPALPISEGPYPASWDGELYSYDIESKKR